jgi:hypothetical protein
MEKEKAKKVKREKVKKSLLILKTQQNLPTIKEKINKLKEKLMMRKERAKRKKVKKLKMKKKTVIKITKLMIWLINQSKLMMDF